MGDVRNLLAWIEIIELEGETCTLTMLHDVTERKLAEVRQTTRLGVTRILAGATTIDAAISGVLQTICQGFGWHFGEMWYVHTEDNRLRCAYLWHEADLAESDFATLTPGLVYERGHDLPGQVWEHGQTVWLDDIGTAPHFVRAAAAQQAGLQSAIASPVRIGTDFDGVMCFFSYHARFHDEMLSETLADIGSQISQFLHRKRTEAALAEERASLQQRVAEATLELSRMNAELSRAVRTKDEFLATMSHELRTPLNAVLGMTEALQEEIYGDINERQNRALSTIESSGRHLLALINDILDVSKIEAGKVELQFDIVAVEAICRTSLQFIQQQALQKRIKVACNMDAAPPTLLADARRLKQILINLLTNAVKFTPEGGQVGLHVTSSPEQDIVHFTVWDTGIGIAPRYQQSLFKPFVQIDSSLSKAHQGTGLGLALVARLTEMHGGSVTLESEDGKGSEFTISLPIGSDSQYMLHSSNDGEQSVELLQKDTGRMILVVEDNEATLEVLQDYLEQYGYCVVVARNGSEALERVAQVHPHLILMDIQMPGMDGLEATRHIRAKPQCAAIPIIAMTALTMPGDRERCLEAGANDYMSKPISLKTLVSTVQSQLTSVSSPTT
jgi:signal transduction histidine kinase/ActR/RegA family two-component response regulator